MDVIEDFISLIGFGNANPPPSSDLVMAAFAPKRFLHFLYLQMSANFFKSAKDNLGSWSGMFGILLTSITIYNIANNIFHLTMPEFLSKMLEGYRAVFHFPFHLLEKYFNISINAYLKDVFVLWTIGAGATGRANNLTKNENDFKTNFSFWRSFINPEWRRRGTYSNFRISIILNFYHWVWRYIIVFFTWPFILRVLFKFTPYLMKYTGSGEYKRHYVYVNKYQLDSYQQDEYIPYKDLRWLFVWQIIFALLAAAFLIFVFSMDK